MSTFTVWISGIKTLVNAIVFMPSRYQSEKNTVTCICKPKIIHFPFVPNGKLVTLGAQNLVTK